MDEIRKLNKIKREGDEARNLLQNEILKTTFDRVEEYITAKIDSCDPDDRIQTQRVVLAKQIFQSIKREIHKLIEYGDVALIQIDELKERNAIRKFMQR